MKKIILFLGLCAPVAAFAQHYEITKAELSAGGILKKDNKIDQNTTGWEAEAFIKFTGLTGTDATKIEVKYHSDNVKKVDADPGATTDETFKLDKAMNDNENTFDVFFAGTKVGSVQYDLKQKTKAVTNDPEGYLGVITSANFIGNNKFLSDLTPIVNLGGVATIKQTDHFSWQMDINPYMGAQINTKDDAALIPALMLYGRAGFAYNNYLNFFDKDQKAQFTLMPFGFGLKFIPNLRDTDNLIIQHNIRFGMAFKYDNKIGISAQITRGWHNLTSSSQKDFNTVFGAVPSDITYATVVVQAAFAGKSGDISNYIFFEWRGLLSKKNYSTFDNNRILTLGLRKTLDLTGGGAFAAGTGNGSNKRNIVRPSL
ncbi:MAG: hypothetical protein JWR09_3714 [Mucilaginibacter sp.]|nr:hypothetical protein [Mucilaginibacter sp.]